MDKERKIGAQEDAYLRIKKKIANFDLRPGSFVTETELARQLNLSRTPVREALRRLEQQGLLITDRNGRKQVYALTLKELDEIFDIKKAIESHIAALAAERKTDEDKEELRRVLSTIDEYIQTNASQLSYLDHDHHLIKEWLKIDNEFHKAVFCAAKNERAYGIVDSLNILWHRQETGLLAMEGRLEKSLAEHVAIGHSILTGQGERASDLMIDHLSRLHRSLSTVMKAFYFDESVIGTE